VILLDTHVVLWSTLTPEKLSAPALAEFQRAEASAGVIGISAVSVYELANGMRRGRIQPAMAPAIFVELILTKFTIVPVSGIIARLAGELVDPFPGDPIDRLIAATALGENCTLLTADSRIRAAGVCRTLW
jgi:PIN domain nuclease of toxin-antitoxin system